MFFFPFLDRYERIDEIVWIKTNQLGGLVRTGELVFVLCFLSFFPSLYILPPSTCTGLALPSPLTDKCSPWNDPRQVEQDIG